MAAAGYLVERSVPLDTKGDYERTGVYQLPKRYGEIVLYYLDDIVLNRKADISNIVISGERLVNRTTGEETFIIGHKSFFGAGVVYNREHSRRLFTDLTRLPVTTSRPDSDRNGGG